MTWSIIARDAASGAFGVALATRFFAAGALCPRAQSGVGALSTQALVNPHYASQALELLRAGVPAPEVVKRVIAPDEGREHRQLHVIDVQGRIGQHTGSACLEWHGPLAGWLDRGGNTHCDTGGAARYDGDGHLNPFPHVQHTARPQS
jgi:uncharacterized Ntn-hydrolase superfamily protein